MISNPTKNAFQYLSRFIHRPNLYILIPIFYAMIMNLVSLFLSLKAIVLMASHASVMTASILTIGNYVLNAALLSAALTLISVGGVAAGMIVGGIFFRAIVETANLVSPLRMKPAAILVMSMLSGSLIGAYAAIKIGSNVAVSLSENIIPILNGLVPVMGATTLILLAGSSVLGLGILFYALRNKNHQFFKNASITKRISKVNLILGLGLGILSAGFSISTVCITSIVVCTVILAQTITDAVLHALSPPFYQALFKLIFAIKDKTLSLQVLFNLNRDDPLVAQLIPHETEVKTLLRSLFLKGLTYNDFNREADIQACLNHLGEKSQSEALSSLMKLGADPVECLINSEAEKAAQELMPLENPILSPGDLRINTLQWQAAKIIAKHNIFIPDSAPQIIKDFVAKAKVVSR